MVVSTTASSSSDRLSRSTWARSRVLKDQGPVIWTRASVARSRPGNVTGAGPPVAPAERRRRLPPENSFRLFETMQQGMEPGPGPGMIFWEGTERSREDFLRIMVEEQRLIYQLEVVRSYGLY
jgi:hypothetical protein